MKILCYRFKTLLFNIVFILINLCKNETIFETISSYPYIKTLLNGNNVLVDSLGIHFMNSDLSNEYETKKILFDTPIESTTDYSKTVISQFSSVDDGYIMILLKNKIYFFQNDGTSLITNPFDLSEIINSDYYNLIPYKKVGNDLYYIISYTNAGQKKLIIHYFKFNNNLENVELYTKDIGIVSQKTNFDPTYLNGGSCIFLFSSSYGYNILLCFYASSYPVEIQVRAFDPNNNFDEINELCNYFDNEGNMDFPDYLSVLENSEKNKAFIIFNSRTAYSLIYDFANNFTNFIKLGTDEYNNLDSLFYRNKFTYYTQTNEYCFVSSLYGIPKIPFMFFNNDFTLKGIGMFQTVSDVYGINTASSYYNGRNYSIIYDDNRVNDDPEKKPLLSGLIEDIIPVEPETPETTIVTTIITPETTIVTTIITPETTIVTTILTTIFY